MLNGGSLNGDADTVYVTSGTSIVLPTPTKHGYTFLGWYESTTATYPVTSPYRVHESKKLYAKWEAGAIITGTKIYTMEDFKKIQSNPAGNYVLMNNIDCDGMALPIIGADANTPFSGIFEGQGYTISNFAPQSNQYIGFVGYNAGTIRNLNISNLNFNIENTNTSNTVYVGGIAGYNVGTIERCTVTQSNITVNLTNPRTAGLIAGESMGNVLNCGVKGTVKVTQPSATENVACAGGVIGANYGVIKDCYANVAAYAYSYKKTYTSTYSNGYAGLITGENMTTGSTISNCFVLGSVTKGNGCLGDIAGFSNGSITNCYKADTVSLATDSGTVRTFATAQSISNLSNKNFYSVSLGWDSSVWNYTNVNIANDVYPSLIQK